jgi:hypothetical protein
LSQSNGGVGTSARLTLYPMVSTQGGAVGFYAFNPGGGYNDPSAGSYWNFKVEEVLPGRNPTLGTLIIQYRDIGQVTISVTLSAVNEQQQVVTNTIYPVTFGNVSPTGRLMTKIVGLNSFTGFLPQLSVNRAANAGPISVARFIICGRVEMKQEFA